MSFEPSHDLKKLEREAEEKSREARLLENKYNQMREKVRREVLFSHSSDKQIELLQTELELLREDFKRARKETHETIERIRKNIEEKRKREDIICPYCQSIQDDEIRNEYVSYWGDEINECQCEHCNKKFMVTEYVEREFTCNKTEGEESEEAKKDEDESAKESEEEDEDENLDAEATW
jgi:hypothetical protein